MKSSFPQIYLARHGETEWSLSGQHTGRTDLPLTAKGEEDAKLLGARLQKHTFAKVFASPLQRAMKSCLLGGFEKEVEAEPLLLEWNYGDYEGLKTKEIRAQNPHWNIFQDGCPGGESPDQIAARCHELIKKLRTIEGDVVLYAHAHILRMLTVCWLSLPASSGSLFFLNTASLGKLGYYHNLSEPVIHLWNDTSHLS